MKLIFFLIKARVECFLKKSVNMANKGRGKKEKESKVKGEGIISARNYHFTSQQLNDPEFCATGPSLGIEFFFRIVCCPRYQPSLGTAVGVTPRSYPMSYEEPRASTGYMYEARGIHVSEEGTLERATVLSLFSIQTNNTCID